VNLYFAELNPGVEFVGGRVFNVKLQGNPSFQNMDIFAAVGANTALVKGADVAVTSGSVRIELDSIPGHDRAKLTAIEITQTSKAPQLVLVFVYPDGTPVSGTLNYTMTTSLLKLGGSSPLVNGRVDCVLFASSQIMGLVGQVQLNLSLTDNAAHTLWQIGMNVDSTSVNLGNVQGSSVSVVVQKM
jgi:Malectin domain